MWYAIKIEPGQEETVRKRIKSVISQEFGGDWQTLYYVRKKRYLGQWHDERGLFLPGYIFYVTDGLKDREKFEAKLATRKNYEDLKTVGRFSTLKAFGNSSVLFPVRSEEEKVLIKLTGGKNEVGMSYGTIQNGVLKVREGVLMGMESRVKKIDRHKRKGFISMKINDEEKIVEIGLEITEKT